MSDQENIVDSISRYAVAGAATDDAYSGLRDAASQVYMNHPLDVREDMFREQCHSAECEFMEINYSNVVTAKHQSGKRVGQWKFRTYLPNAYSTAKTELAKALGEGLDPTGKSKLDLARQRKKNAGPKSTIDEVARKHIRNFIKIVNEMPHGIERDNLIREAECELVRLT